MKKLFIILFLSSCASSVSNHEAECEQLEQAIYLGQTNVDQPAYCYHHHFGHTAN